MGLVAGSVKSAKCHLTVQCRPTVLYPPSPNYLITHHPVHVAARRTPRSLCYHELVPVTGYRGHGWDRDLHMLQLRTTALLYLLRILTVEHMPSNRQPNMHVQPGLEPRSLGKPANTLHILQLNAWPLVRQFTVVRSFDVFLWCC